MAAPRRTRRQPGCYSPRRYRFLANRHARPDKADVADIVLRAGVMTAGQMNIDGRVHRRRCFAKTRDFGGVSFGVGGREATAKFPVQATSPARKRRDPRREPERLDGGASFGDSRIWHAGEQEVLPYGQPHAAVAELLRDTRKAASLRWREPPQRQGDADPVNRVVFEDARQYAQDILPRTRGERDDGARDNLRRAFPRPAPETSRSRTRRARISAAHCAVCAVAMLDKDPQNLVSDLDCLARGHDDAGIAREVLWPVIPPRAKRK